MRNPGRNLIGLVILQDKVGALKINGSGSTHRGVTPIPCRAKPYSDNCNYSFHLF